MKRGDWRLFSGVKYWYYDWEAGRAEALKRAKILRNSGLKVRMVKGVKNPMSYSSRLTPYYLYTKTRAW